MSNPTLNVVAVLGVGQRKKVLGTLLAMRDDRTFWRFFFCLNRAKRVPDPNLLLIASEGNFSAWAVRAPATFERLEHFPYPACSSCLPHFGWSLTRRGVLWLWVALDGEPARGVAGGTGATTGLRWGDSAVLAGFNAHPRFGPAGPELHVLDNGSGCWFRQDD